MSKPLHFCIHGAGGLGSVIGAFLARSGQRVTLIARRAHVEAIRADGLKLDGVRTAFAQRDNIDAVTTPGEVEGDIDYYILLTKGKGTEQALADAAVLADRTATALSLQNGVGKEERLRQLFGPDKVIGGSTMEGGTLVAPGEVQNHSAVPVSTYFGEIGGGESDRTRAIAAAFDSAEVGSRSVDNIDQVLWEKLVQVGAASSFSASTLGAIPALDFTPGISVRAGAEHYVTISRELLSLYHAMGYRAQNFFAPLSRLREIESSSFEEAVDDMLTLAERLSKRHAVRTSMHEDLIAGRKMEVEELLGPLVEAADRLGVAIPTFLGVYRVLTTLNHYLPAEKEGAHRSALARSPA
ncbi:MAG: ketopantoate reductase ApbA/PanE [Alphaproteobacteria bacterium]|nr:ketopantoate reductase ApbA/PanE [Alphaproteobacteria bacterium]